AVGLRRVDVELVGPPALEGDAAVVAGERGARRARGRDRERRGGKSGEGNETSGATNDHAGSSLGVRWRPAPARRPPARMVPWRSARTPAPPARGGGGPSSSCPPRPPPAA